MTATTNRDLLALTRLLNSTLGRAQAPWNGSPPEPGTFVWSKQGSAFVVAEVIEDRSYRVVFSAGAKKYLAKQIEALLVGIELGRTLSSSSS